MSDWDDGEHNRIELQLSKEYFHEFLIREKDNLKHVKSNKLTHSLIEFNNTIIESRNRGD